MNVLKTEKEGRIVEVKSWEELRGRSILLRVAFILRLADGHHAAAHVFQLLFHTFGTDSSFGTREVLVEGVVDHGE
jgi:hypothetical protein